MTLNGSLLRAPAAMLLLGAFIAAAPVLADDGARQRSLATDSDRAKVVARLEAAIPRLMRDGEVPGLSIAVIRGSKVLWSRGFGTKSLETRESVDGETVFEAASLSKPVFAYAVLKLADRGAIDLDAPLSRYLPAPYVDGDSRLDAITARHVLSHTTGFPNWRPQGGPLRIHFAPGERFSYSGEGFVYLQRVVERITGRPLEVFVRQTVFEPLGMRSSSFVWEPRYESRKAAGHDSAGRARPVRQPLQANAAASLHTTATDYARFMIAVMNGVGLRRATVRRMLTPTATVREGCRVCAGAPSAGQPSASVFWGLGWGLQRTRDGVAFWHWGDNNGDTHCYAIGYPRQKTGVVVFTNSGNGHSIIPEVVAEATGGANPAIAWIAYEPYDSPTRRLLREVLARGISAVERYRLERSAGAVALTEEQTNRLGYWLLGRRRFLEAIAVFRMNVEDYPRSWNAYDSLGEAYLESGDEVLAARNYEKSVELNPDNTNAHEVLKWLTGKTVRVQKE